jgi:hypothetical protein
VIADPGTDEAGKADMAPWKGCVAGALSEAESSTAASAAD